MAGRRPSSAALVGGLSSGNVWVTSNGRPVGPHSVPGTGPRGVTSGRGVRGRSLVGRSREGSALGTATTGTGGGRHERPGSAISCRGPGVRGGVSSGGGLVRPGVGRGCPRCLGVTTSRGATAGMASSAIAGALGEVTGRKAVTGRGRPSRTSGSGLRGGVRRPTRAISRRRGSGCT